MAYSCKRRHFCPSCHQKRVVEFGEWLCEKVLKYVPHRQWVFSIPKRLRIYFMMDRKLLAKLSQCAWKVLNLYLTQTVAYDDAKAGAAVAVQSFGLRLVGQARPTARRVIFKIFIRIYIFSPPMAAFTTMTPSWYAHRPILVIFKSCFAVKCSKCSKLKAKSMML